jgi:hypothetical protein
MDVTSYFESLGQELGSVKQRVRHLIADANWQADGEWKESVLRQVLRRHLPASAVVGRGFVVTGVSATSQLDVLIHDGSKPVVFKDGDLAFVTPDAVLGIIEVKSRVNPSQFGAAAGRLAKNIELIRLHPNTRAFAGLFAFDSDGENSAIYLERAAGAAPTWNERLDFAAIGDSLFLKYWYLDPETQRRMYQTWHSYRVPSLAPGYFVHNVVDAVSPESVFRNNEVWFPTAGKEPYRDGSKAGIWAQNAG